MTAPAYSSSPIVLTTDFGLADAFVGVMKGVILSINPQAALIDLTHAIPPQDVRQASFILGVNYPYFPDGTIHVAVVDPGVGTDRRAVLLVTPTARFLAPDNGLLSQVLKDYLPQPAPAPGWAPAPEGLAAFELTNPDYQRHPVSNTFHGRDVFAPAAAYLSLGLPPEQLGRPVDRLVWLPAPQPIRTGATVAGEVLYADWFGNLITNITPTHLAGLALAAGNPGDPGSLVVEVGGRRIAGLSRTFQDVVAPQPDGLPLAALVGSNGYLEIAVSNGSAAAALGAGSGTAVLIALG